jgi:hypothetical protein
VFQANLPVCNNGCTQTTFIGSSIDEEISVEFAIDGRLTQRGETRSRVIPKKISPAATNWPSLNRVDRVYTLSGCFPDGPKRRTGQTFRADIDNGLVVLET